MTPLHTVLAIIVTLIWGINFTFIGWGLESFPPLMLTAMRFFFTAIPLVLFIKHPPFTCTLLIYAIGTFVVQYAFMFTAMHLGASAGLTSLLLQLQIFITVILAYFILGEPVNRMQIVGMVIGLMGLVVIASNLGGDMPLLAFICILIAAAGWSVGNIASKQVSKQLEGNYSVVKGALSLVVWGGLMACGLLTIASLLFETSAWQLATFTSASLKSWLSLGFIVYISTLVAFGLWVYLLSENTASIVMPFALLVPVFGMITSVLLTGEVVTWWKMLAMGLILSGLLLTNLKRSFFERKVKSRSNKMG